MSRVANDNVQRLPMYIPSIADALEEIETEYREMPGLSVTEAQAQRLWGLDSTTCKRALDTLVQRGVLCRTRREAYIKAETFSRLAVIVDR